MAKKSILIGLLTLSLIFCIAPGAISREFVSIMTCGTAGTYYPMGGESQESGKPTYRMSIPPLKAAGARSLTCD